MSHASGRIYTLLADDRPGGTGPKIKGNLIGWFEYNGTVDIALPTIFANADELSAAWRTHGFENQCACTVDLADVRIETDYADYWWHGKACLTHKCIAAGYTSPTEEQWDIIYGYATGGDAGIGGFGCRLLAEIRDAGNGTP